MFYGNTYANIITSDHNGMEFIKKKKVLKTFLQKLEKDYPRRKRLYHKNGILKPTAEQTTTISIEILFASYELQK